MASIRADSAKISGEVKGNIRAKNTLELTPTARVVGDIEAKTLIVSPGAILHGKCAMLGTVEASDTKKSGKRKFDGDTEFTMPRSLIDEEVSA